jgi:UDP-N-acetylmuramoyl-tripeptide--D-alanyl-D-alanine ligase
MGARPFVHLKVGEMPIQTQLIGNYNFPNCCAAVLMGNYFGVALSDIKMALEDYQPKNNRSQIITANGRHIVLDAYNANPTSMNAALESFETLESKHKTVILGDMFELGQSALAEHQEIADKVEKMNFQKAFLVGENFFAIDSKLPRFKSFEAFVAHVKEHPLESGALLIKGSRGMALERVLEYL